MIVHYIFHLTEILREKIIKKDKNLTLHNFITFFFLTKITRLVSERRVR